MIDRDDPADPATVLLVESAADSVSRAERAVETGNYEADLHVVADGSACLDVLREREAPNPGLVILGPGTSGPQSESLLEAMADDPDLRRIPVVVCVPATATRDEIRRCYDRRANAVVVLPDDDAAVVDDLRYTLRFWLAAARLPTPDRSG